MASIHPSRLGLVPRDATTPTTQPSESREQELKRQLLERGGPSRHQQSSGAPNRDETHRLNISRQNRHDVPPHLTQRDSPKRHEDGYPLHRNNNDGPSAHFEHRRNLEIRPRHHDHHDREHDVSGSSWSGAPHRRSPSYQPYPDHEGSAGNRPPPPVGGRHAHDRPPPPSGMPPFRGTLPARGGYQGQAGSGPADMEERRLIRQNSNLSIWPPSPKQSYELVLAAEEKSRRSSKSRSRRSKRSKRYSSESETDSEEEYARERRRRRRREKERRRDENDGWVEKSSRRERRQRSASPKRPSTAEVAAPEATAATDDDDDVVGPQLPVERALKDNFNREAFQDLLPGEGRAMQAFIERGERIPRRGEIGLDSSQIAKYEDSGYVMSGSRHKPMNAVRLRKENQVINAEEKRALLKLQLEEKNKKEGAIISQFKEMMDERLKMEERRVRDAAREARDKELERK